MHKLAQYGLECMQMLDDLKIPYSHDIHMEVNYGADSRWGRCEEESSGYFITINSKLLDDRTDVNSLKETILHELLHTISGCMNHGTRWKMYADMVNKAYGYNIKRTKSYEESGLCDEMIAEMKAKRAEKVNSSPTYVIECTKCGYRYVRHKMSKMVSNPDCYLCGTCHGELMRVQ